MTEPTSTVLRGRGIILIGDRFRILSVATLLAATLAFVGFTRAAPAAGDTRAIAFYNVNTKENLEVTYKVDGRYIPEAMQQINHMMRDWRRDEPTEMDPDLIDLVWELHAELKSQKPIHLISGYRSRKTNSALRRRGGGQARKSQHIQGKAADIHFPDVSVKQLRNSALIREIGGVGYYPTSGIPFVHVDTARVRHWPRLPRQELALLFPKGRSQHVPSDGRPLTKKDYRIALAKVRKDNPSYQPYSRPQPILASFGGPSSLSLPFGGSDKRARTGDITAAIPVPDRRPRTEVAALEPAADGSPLRLTRAVPPQQNGISDLMDDPDHPDLLAYQPTSAISFLTETGLSHPDQSETAFWLTEMRGGLVTRFESRVASTEKSKVTHFQGSAVRSLQSERLRGQLANRESDAAFRTALR